MTRRPDLDARPVPTSRWPFLVAGGLVVSELGLFVGSVPFSVAGLILFGGSCAGLVHESGRGPGVGWTMVVAGGLIAVAGLALWVAGATSTSVDAMAAAPATDGIARRGMTAVLAGGVLVALGGVGGRLTSLGG